MSESTNAQQNGNGVIANAAATVSDIAEKTALVAQDAVTDLKDAVTGDKRAREDETNGDAVISKPEALSDQQKELAEQDAQAEAKEKETGQQQDGVPATVPVSDKPEEPTTGAVVSDDKSVDKAASALKEDAADATAKNGDETVASREPASAVDASAGEPTAAETAPPPAKKAKKEKKEPAPAPARARSTRSTRNTKSYAELDGGDDEDEEAL